MAPRINRYLMSNASKSRIADSGVKGVRIASPDYPMCCEQQKAGSDRFT